MEDDITRGLTPAQVDALAEVQLITQAANPQREIAELRKANWNVQVGFLEANIIICIYMCSLEPWFPSLFIRPRYRLSLRMRPAATSMQRLPLEVAARHLLASSKWSWTTLFKVPQPLDALQL
jgi:hypothetical protein